MPKIVDKDERRREIALSCVDLFLEKGIANLTIAEVAKTAGIGKGTVYEYFENKDDIIFEIVNILLEEKDKKKRELLESVATTKEKIKVFFSFFYAKDNEDLRKLFKEFISITLMSPNETMICHKTERDTIYYNWFKSIFEEGIEKGEIQPNAIKLVKGLYTLGNGIFIADNTTNIVDDIQTEIDIYVDALFEFIEVKNDS